jgi:hypothetical protein
MYCVLCAMYKPLSISATICIKPPLSQVAYVYTSWNSQLWNDIKTDDLEDVNKILLKNLRKMSSDTPVVKGWVVYRSIEDMIKNMSVVLPLINELHSPAMRDRHWKNLAKVCGVKSIDPNDPKFTFEDTVALNVHQHTEVGCVPTTTYYLLLLFLLLLRSNTTTPTVCTNTTYIPIYLSYLLYVISRTWRRSWRRPTRSSRSSASCET